MQNCPELQTNGAVMKISN